MLTSYASQHAGLALSEGSTPTETWAIGACSSLFVQRAPGIPDVDTGDGHRELVELNFTLARLGHWLKAAASVSGRPPDLIQATERVNSAKVRLRGYMQDHNLLGRFSAALFAGTVTGPSGRVLTGGSDQVLKRISETGNVSQASRLVVETAHFGWEGEHTVDASVRAQIGLQPVLTVVSASLEGDKFPAAVGGTPTGNGYWHRLASGQTCVACERRILSRQQCRRQLVDE
jgi:hypothetical protein